jgi:hypothetical protein
MGSPRLLAGPVAVQGRLGAAYPDKPVFETWHRAATLHGTRAFSSEVETGSRQENA